MEEGRTEGGRDETSPPQLMCPDSGPSCPPASHVEIKSFGPSLGIPTSSSHDYSLSSLGISKAPVDYLVLSKSSKVVLKQDE